MSNSDGLMEVEQYVKLCKRRALTFLDAGKPPSAMTSFLGDMFKHPDTADTPGLRSLIGLMVKCSEPQAREAIESLAHMALGEEKVEDLDIMVRLIIECGPAIPPAHDGEREAK
jgi:hypothetical protein